MSATYCPTTGKQCFDTRHKADRVLKIIQHRPGHKRMGAGSYCCPFCHQFHTTQSQNLVQHMRKAELRRKA